nr:uncharacterized protein LOC128696776 [Cherax quadricarinatus]
MSRPTVAKMIHNVLLSFFKSYRKCFIIFLICIVLSVVNGIVLMLSKGANCDCATPASVTMQTPVNNVQQEVNYTTENYGATVPGNTSGHRQDLPSTVNGVTEPGTDFMKQILKQQNELKTMGCKPTKLAVNVPELLAREDALLDKNFEPQQVVVSLCQSSCSYCQSPRKCLPIPGSQRNTTIVLYTIENNKIRYHQRLLVEDTACSCQ